jgi:diadenosine tetraphosphate (Ap4A) HIT family hydrolase
MMTDIHPQLQADCIVLGRFKLCHLLLIKDANYPWCILVPDHDNITEIYQLDADDQQQLMHESSLLGQALMQNFSGDKLNIAALGNVVPQLHIHHVVRYVGDPAWPAPVWGRVAVKPYSDAELNERCDVIRSALLGELLNNSEE